jgi:hypothetical protein
MSSRVSFAVAFLLLVAACPACWAGPDDKLVDSQSIAALQARINQAQPREQCYLYAELLHQMTEFSMRQYAMGNTDKANELLKQIQDISRKVHMAVADNDKRLKNAEILLRRAAFRLNEMLHASSYEDRPLVQETLAQVSRAEHEAMLEVFKK